MTENITGCPICGARLRLCQMEVRHGVEINKCGDLVDTGRFGSAYDTEVSCEGWLSGDDVTPTHDLDTMLRAIDVRDLYAKEYVARHGVETSAATVANLLFFRGVIAEEDKARAADCFENHYRTTEGNDGREPVLR